jgi:hypothetical protein
LLDVLLVEPIVVLGASVEVVEVKSKRHGEGTTL